MTTRDETFETQLSEDRLLESPLAAGSAFAWYYRTSILVLGLIAAGVRVFCAYVSYYQPLEQQQVFVVGLLALAADAWLLTALQMLAIKIHQRNRDVAVASVAIRALQYFPKPFFSYILLAFFMSLGLAQQWFSPNVMLVALSVAFLPLFLWAPSISAAESFSADLPREDEDADEDDVRLRPPQRLLPQFYYLTAKSPWEFGYARSMRLAGQHLGVALKLALLIWFAQTVPPAIVTFVTHHGQSFGVQVVTIVLGSLVDAVVLAIVCEAFLQVLPHEAREEIFITEENPLPTRRFQLARSAPIYLALIGSVLASTVYLGERDRIESSLPPNAHFTLQRAEVLEGNLMLSVDIQDRNRNFRWLLPRQFQLSLPTTAAAAKVKTLDPERVNIYNPSGEELSEMAFRLSYEPIRLVLYFKLPEDVAKQGTFSLSYQVDGLGGQKVLSGNY